MNSLNNNPQVAYSFNEYKQALFRDLPLEITQKLELFNAELSSIYVADKLNNVYLDDANFYRFLANISSPDFADYFVNALKQSPDNCFISSNQMTSLCQEFTPISWEKACGLVEEFQAFYPTFPCQIIDFDALDTQAFIKDYFLDIPPDFNLEKFAFEVHLIATSSDYSLLRSAKCDFVQCLLRQVSWWAVSTIAGLAGAISIAYEAAIVTGVFIGSVFWKVLAILGALWIAFILVAVLYRCATNPCAL